ncbi:class I SAM-dependent methyltransferase [Clostridium sp. ZS2-4]|uniref:class I SAM-dependent methyltransferase n=1 Tax=Clostridium sp. ZS2-4 TaxID=2987703 RepID=UPI00227CD17B|nr:rRNA adenine N-6-methyltransferase family protein [Clostridium sp. ZS2-4]MCY6355452.1 SAM-dependent methyltransferase [Clostridium sp. ZS2-4]
MDKVLFLKQYIRNPRTIGAVMPSSQALAEKMVESIDFDNAKCIVEYGPGTGVFTEKLVENKREDMPLIVIEFNEGLCEVLREKFRNEKNVHIINDSAENIDRYLEDYNIKELRYVVSGLPFASLPKEMSDNILDKTRNILDKDGQFITFQYTLFKKAYIKKFFPAINIKRVIKNFPPAYVFTCSSR